MEKKKNQHGDLEDVFFAFLFDARKKKKARVGRSTSLAILFSTAGFRFFLFLKRNEKLKVQVIHIFKSPQHKDAKVVHRNHLRRSAAFCATLNGSSKSALSRVRAQRFSLFLFQFLRSPKTCNSSNSKPQRDVSAIYQSHNGISQNWVSTMQKQPTTSWTKLKSFLSLLCLRDNHAQFCHRSFTHNYLQLS